MGTRAIRTIAVFVGGLLCTQAIAQGSDPQPSASPATASASPAPTSKPSPRRANSSAAYIEFRVAQIGVYGHSYVAYGRLDARGNPATTHYADLHPVGGYGAMALGHIIPVPANTEWNPEVLTLPVAHKYRVNLNEAQFKKLQAALEVANARKARHWNAFLNNCNHFVGELAQAIGLRVPTQFHMSYGFVPDLQQINESSPAAKPAATRQASKRANATALPVAAQ